MLSGHDNIHSSLYAPVSGLTLTDPRDMQEVSVPDLKHYLEQNNGIYIQNIYLLCVMALCNQFHQWHYN